MEEALVVAIFFFCLPLWIIFHHITKWKQMNTMSADTEMSFGDLHKTAERLEGRLRTLERILDEEVPDWRSRHDTV